MRRARQQPRVGRVHAIDVGVNLAGIRLEHRRQRHGCRIAAAASQRRDVEIFVDSLKSGGNHDFPFGQRTADACGGDRLNARLRVRAVGLDADLGTGEADRFVAERVNGHRHQRHAHLLAGRQQHVHLAAGG